MKNPLGIICALVLICAIGLANTEVNENSEVKNNIEQQISVQTEESLKQPNEQDIPEEDKQVIEPTVEQVQEQNVIKDFSEDRKTALSNIPKYSSEPYVIINNNIPYFNTSDLTTNSYEEYSSLDSLGRCGVAIASIGKDIMPTEERGSIGSVKPTGWHTVRYAGVDGNYLYNRCHLLGYQLTGENANTKNLITGTRYMNVEGMLPFENMVADYVKETGNHVLYRVTPIFEGNNLLASGVLMEAKSVEDGGKGIEFNVYCYNVQPGIQIDYATGESSGPEYTGSTTSSSAGTNTNKTEENTSSVNVTSTYILNTNTKKFHESGCSSVKQMSEKNKKAYTGNRSDIISMGYDPCGRCNP